MPDVLIFAIGALAFMLATLSLLDSLAARLQAPLPILASVTGLMLGGGAIFVDLGSAGWMLDTYDLWFISELALTPDSVVVLFLPPLLLEVTLGVDVRKLRADTVVVAVMAILAVLAATAFVGGTLALVAGLPLVACLLLGA
ncbi:MAG: cation:proton antiporter, partial [Geminicoccaceae bacterium]|nr:cation:proton antiporter [Geminicoccaceae bacterium]